MWRWRWRLLMCWTTLLSIDAGAIQGQDRPRIEKNEQTISILSGTQPILVYNVQPLQATEGIDRVYERSGFLHPVYSPTGQVLTAAFPSASQHIERLIPNDQPTTNAGGHLGYWEHADLVSDYLVEFAGKIAANSALDSTPINVHSTPQSQSSGIL